MQISIKGFSKAKTKELREAADFFARQLMHGRMVNNLMIDIEKVRRLDVMGECVNEDDTRNPRWFTINLRDASGDDDVVKTLAHEMVHVKQYAKNEMKTQMRVTRGGGFQRATVWQGEVWNPKSKEDEYWDCPWEIEAYGREVGLYHKWVQRFNDKQHADN